MEGTNILPGLPGRGTTQIKTRPIVKIFVNSVSQSDNPQRDRSSQSAGSRSGILIALLYSEHQNCSYHRWTNKLSHHLAVFETDAALGQREDWMHKNESFQTGLHI